MLIDDNSVLAGDPIMKMVGMINGNIEPDARLQQGIYLVGHFGSSSFLSDYDQYPDLGEFGSYGVCDGVENLLSKVTVLQDEKRKFVVTLTSVKRANQPSDGGWRWHKWGEYIGAHEPQHEYLHDEEGIDEVFCYHVYERKQ